MMEINCQIIQSFYPNKIPLRKNGKLRRAKNKAIKFLMSFFLAKEMHKFRDKNLL